MKHVFTIVNAVLASMALGGSYIHAADPVPWNGSTKTPDFNGNTYIIISAEELAWIAYESQENDFSGKIIRLEADIDLGGNTDTPTSWQPIGSASQPFRGELDGNNHVIYNLYILSSLLPQGAGLIAETGTEAVVHHLGIGQGQIMTDAASNIGGFIGINRGRLHHCFNMLQLIAHAGNNVGGLVGKNSGEIAFCYNAGIITDANSYVGGLVGYNESSARITECYNMGYCKGSDHVGALFGKNEAPESQLTKVVFDQQLTRMYATGDGANDKIMRDNTLYAIEKSSLFSSPECPFYEEQESEWHYDSNETWSHPQLLCFTDHPASHVSVKAIRLDAEERPIERAEGVGTPIEGNNPRKRFGLETINHSAYGKSKWHSPSPDVIYIQEPTSQFATVNRPCGNQEVILTLSYDKFVKQIYTIVKGYDTFDAGIANGHVYACWNEEGVGFKDNNKDGKEPSAGKDDEQKNDNLSYHYRIIRDTVIQNDEALTYRTLDVTPVMSQETYKGWCMPTDVPGEYAFRREVHDTQCKTEWTASEGRLFLTVRKQFDAGELVEKPDTIYAVLPQTLTIESYRDASGGGEVFNYTWIMERSEWNADSLDWMPIPEDTRNPLYINGSPVGTPSFDYTFTQPGMYSFTRQVKEESCTAQPVKSKRPHIVVVYEAINAGSIEHFERKLCAPICTDTIHETNFASNGDGIYSYRWLCNGEPLPESDTTIFLLENIPMQAGNTYTFVRQVKDNTGLSGWVTSDGQVTISVFGDYKAGSIQPSDEQLCTASSIPQELSVHIRETEPAQGDEGSEFIYCWLLYRGGEDSKPIDTIRNNSPELNSTIPLGLYRLSVPVTLFIKRGVKNALCESEWKISENSVSWRFGQAEKKTIPVTICAGELPYDYTYTYTDGHSETFRFSSDGQSFPVHDETAEGCPMEITLRSEIIPVPIVVVEPIVSVCQTADHMDIAYTVLSGHPDRFDLLFSEQAKEAGFRDSIGAILPSSDSISIPLPAGRVPLGSQSLTMVFYTHSSVPEACKASAPQTLSFSIDLDGYVYRKGEDIIFVDNSGLHTANGLTFIAYQWYRDGVPIHTGTDQFFYEYSSLDGIYQVEMTTADGTVYRSCLYDMRPTPDEPQGMEATPSPLQTHKLLINGRIVLKIGEDTYTIFGQKIQ